MKQLSAILKKLTFDDLRDWAGAKILGRGQGYIDNVDQLSRTADGGLAAWVSGSEEYATSVRFDADGDLEKLLHLSLRRRTVQTCGGGGSGGGQGDQEGQITAAAGQG